VSLTVTQGVSVVGVAGWQVTGNGGRGQPASSRRWAVQVLVFTLHTGAGWAR